MVFARCSHGVRTPHVVTPAVSPNCLGKALQIEEADARTRTGDPFITSEVLYQLSYVGGVREV